VVQVNPVLVELKVLPHAIAEAGDRVGGDIRYRDRSLHVHVFHSHCVAKYINHGEHTNLSSNYCDSPLGYLHFNGKENGEPPKLAIL